MTIIQSSSVPLWLSGDGVNYKQLVCTENYTFKMTTQVVKTLTFCGLAVGVGVIEFDIQFSAVCEAAPTAQQVTLIDIKNWQLNGTLMYFKMQYPSPGSTGNNVFFAGNVYATDLSVPIAVNQAVKFTGTLTGTGQLS